MKSLKYLLLCMVTCSAVCAFAGTESYQSCASQKFLAIQELNPGVEMEHFSDPWINIGSCTVQVNQPSKTISLATNGVKFYTAKAELADEVYYLPADGLALLKKTLSNCGCSTF